MDRRRQVETEMSKMYWKKDKKLEDSSLRIDFGLILTNLPCSGAEALLIPDGCLILIHHVLGCQDQTSVLHGSAYLLKRVVLRILAIRLCRPMNAWYSAFPIYSVYSVLLPSVLYIICS